MPKAFVDTNVVVYANDLRDPGKQGLAANLLRRLADGGDLVISAQVMHEYAAVAVAKLRQDPEQVSRQVRLLGQLAVVPLTPDLICQAIGAVMRYRLSYWDACIVVAAASAGCTVLYSEDLNAGQAYLGVQVVNPFSA